MSAGAREDARTALFDLDGTLTDSKPGIIASTLYALRRVNETTGARAPIPEPDALGFMLGPPLRESFARLVAPALVEPMVGFFRERYRSVGLFESGLFPGIAAALEDLRGRGWRMLVATSKNEADARRIVDHFGLARFFACVYGSQDDGTRSNKGELIAYVIAQRQLDARRAVMIGDREHDALGAKAAGVAAIGALWGYGSREALREAGADPLVETPEGLPAALESRIGRAAGLALQGAAS